MNKKTERIAIIALAAFLMGYFFHQVACGTNESSYRYGYELGTLTSPWMQPGANVNPTHFFYHLGSCQINPSPSKLNNGKVIPAVTNTTACIDGFFNGWKNWCSNHAVDCVQNFTIGYFPEMILKAHEQLLAGEKAATGNSMCPIGENAAFCAGWDNNNADYGGQFCSDQPLANITVNLVGCPEDIMTASQIAGLPALIGKWNFVNETSNNMAEISGTMNFANDGHLKVTVPSKTGFGDYTLEGSWGYIGHNILTQCYAGGCENSTLTALIT
jgi:hypothetical protein